MDVVVVGAGPAGCAAGARAAELGAQVRIYEEHKKIGEPVACSAIVSRRGLDACGVEYEALSFNKLRGVFCHMPDGVVLRVKADHDVANVFDRAKYDKLCAKKAEKAGAEIITGRKCGEKELRKFVADKNALIGADGVSSLTAKTFGFPPIKEFFFCYQEDLEGASFEDEQSVHVFISCALVPGFFAWAIPLGKDRVRVGCGVTEGHNARKMLEMLVAKEKVLQDMLDGAEVVSRLGGVIPGRARYQTVERRVMLVGDAAGQAKATTGGGIYFGTMCGRLAGGIAAKAKKEAELAKYETEWRALYGRDLMLHRKLRSFADRVGDDQLCVYASLAKGMGIEYFLSHHGDMDSVSAMLASLKKNNPMAVALGRLLGELS